MLKFNLLLKLNPKQLNTVEEPKQVSMEPDFLVTNLRQISTVPASLTPLIQRLLKYLLAIQVYDRLCHKPPPLKFSSFLFISFFEVRFRVFKQTSDRFHRCFVLVDRPNDFTGQLLMIKILMLLVLVEVGSVHQPRDLHSRGDR